MAEAGIRADPAVEASGKSRAVERGLFWTCFLSFAYFYQGADQSVAARFDLMRSIIERRTLWIDGYCGYNTADIVSVGGHYYSVKAPGGSLTGIVQWWFFTTILAPLFAHHEALYWALTTWLTTVFSTGLIVAIACVALFRLVTLFGGTIERGIVCALILAFGTIMFPYATEMTGEPIAGSCALLAFYLLASQRPESEPGRAMFAGVLTGWSVLCDFPTILIALPLAVYALVRLRRFIPIAAFAIGAAAVAMVLLAYNRAGFGNPLFLSYQAYKLTGNSQFPEQATGFVGLTYPRLNLLSAILITPQRGLFFCNPVLLLSLVGIAAMSRQRSLRKEWLVMIFVIVAMILFNASFGESIVSWGGGTATGPRQIVAIIPFAVLALAFTPTRWNWVLAPLAIVSVCLMLMATAVEPHFPYEYENPLVEFIWPAYLRGDFAYDRDAFFGGAAIVDQSTAFNLGKLAGIPGPFQLWPLAVLWFIAGWRLINSVADQAARRRLRLALRLALIVVFFPPVVARALVGFATEASNGLQGRYYRGLTNDGFAPHIVRVDKEINFGSVAELGALPAPSRAIWHGSLTIRKAGLYSFAIEVDDSGWLMIDGVPVIADPGNVNQSTGAGSIALSVGNHRIELGERNLAGDAAMRLFWRLPGEASQEIVPSRVLVPD